MPLSRSFKETVKERIDEDPAFRLRDFASEPYVNPRLGP